MVLGGRAKMRAALQEAQLFGKYMKMHSVGSGSFGEVFKVWEIATSRILVQKESKPNKVDDSFANEIATLLKLEHPNVVSLVEWGMIDGKLSLVLEFVAGGSLDDVIHQLKEPMPEDRIREYVRQILYGLDHCHTRGVCHRDIKAKNILVTLEGVIKLADFGGAKEAVELASGKDLMTATDGLQATVLWMAPELFDNRFNCKADIWSLGCVMIEMATRKKPWDEKKFDNIFVAMKFLEGVKSGPPMPENLSPAAQNFLNRCFTVDHTLRPTAKELLQDKWILNEGAHSFPFEFATAPEFTPELPPTNISTGSEAPQGPESSVGSNPETTDSKSSSVGEVKIKVSKNRPPNTRLNIKQWLEDEEEIKNRNWIFALPPPTTDHQLTSSAGADTLLNTADFLGFSRKALDASF